MCQVDEQFQEPLEEPSVPRYVFRRRHFRGMRYFFNDEKNRSLSVSLCFVVYFIQTDVARDCVFLLLTTAKNIAALSSVRKPDV